MFTFDLNLHSSRALSLKSNHSEYYREQILQSLKIPTDRHQKRIIDIFWSSTTKQKWTWHLNRRKTFVIVDEKRMWKIPIACCFLYLNWTVERSSVIWIFQVIKISRGKLFKPNWIETNTINGTKWRFVLGKIDKGENSWYLSAANK